MRGRELKSDASLPSMRGQGGHRGTWAEMPGGKPWVRAWLCSIPGSLTPWSWGEVSAWSRCRAGLPRDPGLHLDLGTEAQLTVLSPPWPDVPAAWTMSFLHASAWFCSPSGSPGSAQGPEVQVELGRGEPPNSFWVISKSRATSKSPLSLSGSP